MATYIQGLTDYVPEIQPFQPDLKLYSTALQTMQTKYDTNYKKLSDYYGKLLKSPMLRDSDIQRRDQFIKNIDNEIKKISGVDLSLEQNVSQAMKVLDPIIKDKNIVSDILATKQWMDQKEYGQNAKSTVSGWDGGLQILDYWAEEYKKVSDEDALTFRKPEFIPRVDWYEMAMSDAVKNKFVVKKDNLSEDGKWLVTNQNGDLIAPNLQNYFIARFGSDPQVVKYFNAQAYLERKNYIKDNLAKYDNNEARAQIAFAQEKLNDAIEGIKSKKYKADDEKKAIDALNDAFDDFVSKNGVLPTDQDVINVGRSLKQAQNNANLSNQALDGAFKTLELYMKDYDDFLNNGTKLDQILGFGKMGNAFANVASNYAHMTEERLIKGPNDYYLEGVKQANRMALEDYKFKNDLIKEEFKYNLKQKKKREEMGLDQLEQIENMPGASTPMSTSGLKENMDKSNELFADVSQLKASMLSDMASNMVKSYEDANPTNQKAIRAAIDNIYGPLGIKPEELLNPATRGAALKKIGVMQQSTNPNLFASYKALVENLDPKNVHNNAWAEAIRRDPTYWKNVNNIKTQDKNLNNFMSDRMEQLKDVRRFFQNKDNDPTGLVSAILSESTNGFWPGDYRKEAIINKLVAANEKKFGKDNIYDREYFVKNWDAAKKVWDNSLDKIPNYKAYNHIEGLGPNSNASATMGVGGYFNYSNRSKGSHTNTFDAILKDVSVGLASLPTIEDNAGGALLVGYGNNGTILETSDASAVEDLRVMIDTKGVYTNPKDKKVFAGRFEYANISQNDPNYIGVTIYPSRQYIEGFKETKDKARAISGKPITIRIPRSMATNPLYRQATTSANEYSYERGGLDMSYPSGNANIRKTSAGPVVDYTLNIYNSTRKDYDVRSFSQPYLQGTDIDGIVNTYDAVLYKLYEINSVNIANDRMVYGLKDINKILEETAKAAMEQNQLP